MNVWVPGSIGAAIDEADREWPLQKSRQEAITHALEAIFARKERIIVT